MSNSQNNFDRNQDNDSEFAYPTSETPVPIPIQSRSSGFGFGLFDTLRSNRRAEAATPAESTTNDKLKAAPDESAAHFAGMVNSPLAHTERPPVYRGQYKNLTPLFFDTSPVDDAANTFMECGKQSAYNRHQLFSLLRLERFLRLRYYWQLASPRQDEQWKTTLAVRGVYTALRDCIQYGVGDEARTILKKWDCE